MTGLNKISRARFRRQTNAIHIILLSVILLFLRSTALSAADIEPGIIDRCKIALQNWNVLPVRDVPELFKFHPIVRHQLFFFRQNGFEEWKMENRTWQSVAEISSPIGAFTRVDAYARVDNDQEKFTVARLTTDDHLEDIHLWISAAENRDSIEQSIEKLMRIIIYARATVKRPLLVHLRPKPRPSDILMVGPVIRVRVEKKGVAIKVRVNDRHAILFLNEVLNLLREGTASPTETLLKLSEREVDETNLWMLSFLEQSSIARTHVITFENLLNVP